MFYRNWGTGARSSTHGMMKRRECNAVNISAITQRDSEAALDHTKTDTRHSRMAAESHVSVVDPCFKFIKLQGRDELSGKASIL